MLGLTIEHVFENDGNKSIVTVRETQRVPTDRPDPKTHLETKTMWTLIDNTAKLNRMVPLSKSPMPRIRNYHKSLKSPLSYHHIASWKFIVYTV